MFPAVLILVFCSSAVLANISITAPIDATVWSPNHPFHILWSPHPSFSSESHPIDLLRGNPNALTLVQQLASAIPENAAQFSGTVDPHWGSGEDFVIRIGNAYSHFFTIQNSKGGVTSTPPSPALGAPKTGLPIQNGTARGPSPVPNPGVNSTLPGIEPVGNHSTTVNPTSHASSTVYTVSAVGVVMSLLSSLLTL